MVIITKNCRLHNQLFVCNDFAARERPQYIVVPLTYSKMKDMFTYHNECKTIKIAVRTANLEKKWTLAFCYLSEIKIEG